jgi:hypothetical protein
MTIKLKGSTDGSVSLQAPADTSPTGTDKTFTLPTADGTAGQVLSTNGSGALSFVNAITEVDQWYLTADQTSDGTLTSLARNNHEAATQIGTGMSVSSGVFTFPSTGKWLIYVQGSFTIDVSDSVILNTKVTLNNSNYFTVTVASDGATNVSGTPRNGGASSMYFMDVTDTSLTKVQFVASSISNSSKINGRTANIETGFVFIRLGDT